MGSESEIPASASADAETRDRIAQYEMAAFVARELITELGAERGMGIIGRALDAMMTRQGTQLATRLGSNEFAAFAAHLKTWAARDDTWQVLTDEPDQLAIRITRCPNFEAFVALGLQEVGRRYYEADWAYAAGFNPRLRLTRPQSIAEGDEVMIDIWTMDTA